jgi:hypothetical protein
MSEYGLREEMQSQIFSLSVCLCNAGNGVKFTHSNVLQRNSSYGRKCLEEYKCLYLITRLYILVTAQAVRRENISFCKI